jgi:DNA helicase TIP49 (TBP-interacting protein)
MILAIRAKTEGSTDASALQLLSDIEHEPVCDTRCNANAVQDSSRDHGTDANIVQDVENVDGLFLDGKASAQMLQHAEGFMA